MIGTSSAASADDRAMFRAPEKFSSPRRQNFSRAGKTRGRAAVQEEDCDLHW